ncbi:hypothetical protein KP509_24G073500, partial [Ceratopteris richardii]
GGHDHDDDPYQDYPYPSDWNPCLGQAFHALQAWKDCIDSDPGNVTGSWVGYDVCKYRGVFCSAPPPGDANATTCEKVVSGIDLNGAGVGGTLPEELGLLEYLAFFHLNSNSFRGTLPTSISCWRLLYELDVSNNLLSGPFPEVTLSLPNLVYLDIRFNSFNGPLPSDLFNLPLDAIFINSNQFDERIPESIGNSPVSVIVFASNNFEGGIPASVQNMNATLQEIIFLGNDLRGCVPPQFGGFTALTVLDISSNSLSGTIPSSLAQLTSLQQLNVAHNFLSGQIPDSICSLQNLINFTASFNYFTGEAPSCLTLATKNGDSFNDSNNCIIGRPDQRSVQECAIFFTSDRECPAPKPPPPPSPPPPPECPPPPPSPPPPPECPPPPPPPPPCDPPAADAYQYWPSPPRYRLNKPPPYH